VYCGAKHTEGLTTDVDLLAVGLVDDVVDQLKVVGVGDDLVVGDDILKASVSKRWPAKGFAVCGICWRQKKKAG
jgi:hypothetical protein